MWPLAIEPPLLERAKRRLPYAQAQHREHDRIRFSAHILAPHDVYAYVCDDCGLKITVQG